MLFPFLFYPFTFLSFSKRVSLIFLSEIYSLILQFSPHNLQKILFSSLLAHRCDLQRELPLLSFDLCKLDKVNYPYMSIILSASTTSDLHTRLVNTLYGMFIGDVVAAPVHWYYQNSEKEFEKLKQKFPKAIYFAPDKTHSESFAAGSSYNPDIPKAKQLGRQIDILHQNRPYFSSCLPQPDDIKVILSSSSHDSHGNSLVDESQRLHYHYGLAAGENTVNLQVLHLLLKDCLNNSQNSSEGQSGGKGPYNPDTFLKAWVRFFTTHGSHNDLYIEVHIRKWFENYSKGLPDYACAASQRDIWSIGSMSSLIRPLAISLLYYADGPTIALGHAVIHQSLTQKTENGVTGLSTLISLIFDLLRGSAIVEGRFSFQKFRQILTFHAKKLRLPDISGKDLLQLYRNHQGPGNIPHDLTWNLHTTYRSEKFDLPSLAKLSDPQVIHNIIGTVCYVEHGLPLCFYLMFKYGNSFIGCLEKNAKAGGDSVHRGAIIGAVLGAAGHSIHPKYKKSLLNYPELDKNVVAFIQLVNTD